MRERKLLFKLKDNGGTRTKGHELSMNSLTLEAKRPFLTRSEVVEEWDKKLSSLICSLISFLK